MRSVIHRIAIGLAFTVSAAAHAADTIKIGLVN